MRSKINVHKHRALPKSISDEGSLPEIGLGTCILIMAMHTFIHIFYR